MQCAPKQFFLMPLCNIEKILMMIIFNNNESNNNLHKFNVILHMVEIGYGSRFILAAN